jgi:hypothetical protein
MSVMGATLVIANFHLPKATFQPQAQIGMAGRTFLRGG